MLRTTFIPAFYRSHLPHFSRRQASNVLSSKQKLDKKKGDNLALNPKIVALANYLYEEPPSTEPITANDWQINETIEEAWKMYCEEKQKKQDEALKKKYLRMREAMLELEKHHPNQFKAAMNKEGEELYVHRMLKSPTFTPGKQLWPE